MTDSEAATVLARLDACRARLALLAAHSAGLQRDELDAVRDQLAAVEAELRSFVDSVQRRAPTPSTLRSLLAIARADLAAELPEDGTPAEQLDCIVRLAQALVPGTEHAGVSALRGQVIQTLAATSAIPAQVDRLQGELGEGPILQLQVIHDVVRIDDTHAELRWPKYAVQMQRLGLRSALLCEVPMRHATPSGLSLYARRRHAFSSAAELLVPVFAARAAVALVHAAEITNLHKALVHRQVIGQAVGFLMERHRLTAEEAFIRLVSASQHRHVKLRELAARMAETGEEPEYITL